MKRKTAIDWSALIAEYQKSGITVEEFCGRKNIHPSNFYRNRKKYQSSDSALVQIQVPADRKQESNLSIRIHDYIIEIPNTTDAVLLETTLRILKGLVCS